ncbi:hypothetical protein [Micromonospora antibiotica]|uniref:WXG100 family type VII secretion target n=1 Tax=Micromonospora antibiotica TaxID=2807623 RepID=A0ABS3V8M3_9ACTN|nr:hypothetical protein [Micromonospora antibiotica]MBO4161966.1 hypothetical protein [Micromonospora antibiotica]
MSQPRGAVWVDPEGVISVGDSYAQHTAHYDECLRQLGLIRARYTPAWGDDEIGNQFQKQFDQTMDVVEGAVRGVNGLLEYAAVGLRVSGEGYRQADEDATGAGRVIANEFVKSPPEAGAGQVVPGEPAQPAGQPLRYGQRLHHGRALSEGRLTYRGQTVSQLAPRQGDDSMTRGMAVPGAIGEPAESLDKLPASSMPAGFAAALPAISAYRPYDTTGVLVDGEPIPPGYQLQALATFPDGTSRLDANYYDSIIPLGGRRPTSGDGAPIDGNGDQLFLVKPKADAGVDASVPGYRPLLVSFDASGAATPLIVNPA